MPDRGWRHAWELYYRPIEIIAAECLIIFVLMRVVLHEESWWSEVRYGWIAGDTLVAQAFTLIAGIVGAYGLLPRPRDMTRGRLLFHDFMRAIGAGCIIWLNGLTMVHSFEAHGAAPVATWGVLFGFVILFDIAGEW